jgi:hypothetical protein
MEFCEYDNKKSQEIYKSRYFSTSCLMINFLNRTSLCKPLFWVGTILEYLRQAVNIIGTNVTARLTLSLTGIASYLASLQPTGRSKMAV